MKIINTLPSIKLIIAVLSFVPCFSFGQLSASASNDFAEIEDETVKTTEESSTVSANVLDVKKMTRYSLAFVVELPSIGDVLTYMNENLGIDTQEADVINDPNWTSTSYTTRNFEVQQNDSGDFEVKVRFYPPVDPMNAEVQGIQRKSRVMCWEALQQLKADASQDERSKF